MSGAVGGEHDALAHHPQLYHQNSFHQHQHHRSSSYSLGEGSVSGYESEENLTKWRIMCNNSLAKVSLLLPSSTRSRVPRLLRVTSRESWLTASQ